MLHFRSNSSQRFQPCSFLCPFWSRPHMGFICLLGLAHFWFPFCIFLHILAWTMGVFLHQGTLSRGVHAFEDTWAHFEVLLKKGWKCLFRNARVRIDQKRRWSSMTPDWVLDKAATWLMVYFFFYWPKSVLVPNKKGAFCKVQHNGKFYLEILLRRCFLQSTFGRHKSLEFGFAYKIKDKLEKNRQKWTKMGQNLIQNWMLNGAKTTKSGLKRAKCDRKNE